MEQKTPSQHYIVQLREVSCRSILDEAHAWAITPGLFGDVIFFELGPFSSYFLSFYIFPFSSPFFSFFSLSTARLWVGGQWAGEIRSLLSVRLWSRLRTSSPGRPCCAPSCIVRRCSVHGQLGHHQRHLLLRPITTVLLLTYVDHSWNLQSFLRS